MPFGLTNVPASFNRMMDRIFRPYRKFTGNFFDDILVFSETEEEHKKHLDIVFQELRKNELHINAMKSKFFLNEIHYLGHIVSHNKSEHKAKWEQYSPLVEYANNNTVHSSTGKAPFEIVESGKKVSPILYTKDKIFEADKYVHDMDDMYNKVKVALEKTRAKQKKAADRHRREVVFSLDDWVLCGLKRQDLRRRRKARKDCFQSSLWAFSKDMPAEEQPEDEELDEILVPEQLLAHKERKVKGKASKTPTQTQKASSQSLQPPRQSGSNHLQRRETSKEQRSNNTKGKGHVVEQPPVSIGHRQPSTHGSVNGQDSNEQTMRQTIPLPMSNAGCFGGGSVFQAMIRPSPALHGFMPDNAYGAMPPGGGNPLYGNIGVQPGFQCPAGSYGMPGVNLGMAGFAQPDAQNLNMAGRPGVNFGSGMPLLNAPAYDNLTPKGKPKDYKEGGQAVKFDTFHGTHDNLKALLFLQQFDAAFAGGNFTEASKIRLPLFSKPMRFNGGLHR
ncbi:hypothetical protein L7F22_029568 [Adiantum nelumboides]|nr:hypothetical protein [Adiantum nelumboides]